jgi:hypothetical protein
LGQQCLNSFVLTNIDLIETPILQDAIENNLKEHANILQEQIFLQDQGVSFSYSDSISYVERKDLVQEYIKYLEIKNERIEEATRNARKN